jgi:antitoxin (DNA-binding transcriptional repressor) of toxin-antitoxin stability system
MQSCWSISTANVTITKAGETAATVTPNAPSATIRLFPIKLKQFSGDIDMGEFLGGIQAVTQIESVTNNNNNYCAVGYNYSNS